MRVLVLGANGFIGSRLVDALLKRDNNTRQNHFTQIVASDLYAPTSQSPSGLVFVEGNLCKPDFLDQLFAEPFDAIFHLASALTFDAEMDFERGLQINVHALMYLLERCRKQATPPKFLFASSISTFGGLLPETVDDFVFQTPQTSYGTHKVIAEQLINDYSRRGFIDGRVLRLPIVLTHPGPPTSSVSDRVASLIRDPLNGRDVVFPLAADTRMPVASVNTVVNAFLRLCELPATAFEATRAMNLPALTVTPAQLAESLSRHATYRTLGHIAWEPDPALQDIVEGWPRAFTSALAIKNNIHGDTSADAIIDAYLEAQHGAV